jgi:hypothetical protein
MTRAVVVQRGLEKLDALGGDLFFIIADAWWDAATAPIAAARRPSVLGRRWGTRRSPSPGRGPAGDQPGGP